MPSVNKLPVGCSATMGDGSLSTAGALLVLSLIGTVAFALYAGSQGVFFEMAVQRTWSRVCRNLGGSFTAEVFSLGNSVRTGIESRGKHYVGNQYKKIYPKLLEVHGVPDAWTGLVKPNPGQTLDDYTKNSSVEAFTLAFNVQSVAFERTQNGRIAVRAGKVAMPAPHNFQEQQIWGSNEN
jgi:hypothetical protein